jgi:hypothetical protein
MTSQTALMDAAVERLGGKRKSLNQSSHNP